MSVNEGRNGEPVIVIGAGAAGLAAARLLQHHGREVVVLEGRDRVGGRASTIELDGARIDEGGAWIDGHRNNPAMRWAEAAGLPTTRADYIDPLRFAGFDAERGRWLRRFEAIRHLVAVNRIYERLGAAEAAGDDHLSQRIDRTVEAARGSESSKRLRNAILRSSVESNWADRSDLLGAHAVEIGEEYEGGEAAIIGGYGRLATALAAGLDIRLEHTVTSVRHDDGGVEVVAGGLSFRGSHAVVTLPLGVLKARAIVFDPPLPSSKVEAIDDMGYGRLEKVLLRFDETFWRLDPARPRNLYVIEPDTPFPFFFDFTDGAGQPVLAALVTGDHGSRFAADSSMAVREAMAALERLFPGRVPAPVATHTTAWQLDPLALGSYSTIGPDTTVQTFEQLVAPVGDRLLFAGEATSVLRPGYVDGAVDSGVREAGRILGFDVDLLDTLTSSA